MALATDHGAMDGRVAINRERTVRQAFTTSKELDADIDAYQRRKKLTTKADAIRRLVQIGLEAEGSPEPPPAPAQLPLRVRQRPKGEAR